MSEKKENNNNQPQHHNQKPKKKYNHNHSNNHNQKDKQKDKPRDKNKISEHFNRTHFACTCGNCNQEFRMSLALIGILEHLKAKFNQNINVHRAYVCEDYAKELFGNSKDYHSKGKAIDISINNVELKDIFNEVENLIEITGIGFVPSKGILHIDMRDKDRNVFIVENGTNQDLTLAMRNKYGLQDLEATS